jgi:transcriptional regulator with XRE-family HTH domain
VQTLSTALGKAIRRHRKLVGWSQEQLAERAELHRNEVSFVERGLRSPRVEVLVRLGEALGVPGWLLLRQAQEEAREESDVDPPSPQRRG